MTLGEFFNCAIVSLPKSGFNDSIETFDHYLSGLFDSYFEAMGQIDDPSIPGLNHAMPTIISTSKALSSSLVLAVQNSLNGRTRQAHEEISRSLASVNWIPFRTVLQQPDGSINLSDPFSPYLYAIQHPALYRIRSQRNDYEIPDRGHIFHIPYEKRRIVSNQRYSIAGLPCLYLGSSLWICWEELGRPPFDNTWMSRFDIIRPVTVIDLQFSPHQLWRFYEALQEGTPRAISRESENELKTRFDIEFIKSYAAIWPLIAACSISRQQRIGSFVPEYIVPQLLLQWVTQEKRVDGIRYFSMRTPTSGSHLLAHSNCVFPARTILQKGFCPELTHMFSLTEPVLWEAMTAVNFGDRPFITNTDANAFAPINLNNDLSLQYSQTDFFKNEVKLNEIAKRPDCSRTINS